MAENVKEFYQEFMQQVREEATNSGTSSEQQLTSFALEYIKDDGSINYPDLITCSNTSVKPTDGSYYKITAFDYSEETGVLDLFTTVYFESDSVSELKKSHLERSCGWLTRFLNLSIEKDEFYKYYQNEDPDVADIIYTIRSEYKAKNISLIRLFIISNGLVKEEDLEFSDESKLTDQNIDFEFSVWDIEAMYRSDNAAQNDGSIDIDLNDVYGHSIECLPVEENSEVKSYLAVMPAIILAKVYKDYGARLLNQNVRTYLGGKVKVNKKMAETIREQPNMFFAYNNGISSTATEVITKNEEGRVMITNIRNWQIVNGGQTTNTIYSSYKKKQSLDGVSLSLKISEIKVHSDEKHKLISDIARNANSQTQIKESDLSSNHQYMKDLDDFSQKTVTPLSSARKNTYWFFERMRGQYDMSKGAPRSAKAKKFMLEHPKSQMFTKVDIAKVEMAWMSFPYVSCTGGEKCFNKYYKEYVLNGSSKMDASAFRRLIAKFIIVESIEKSFKAAGMKGYGNIVSNYTLAAIALKSQGKFDFEYVWNHQEINAALRPFIDEVIKIVYNYIIKVSSDGTNASSEAKKIDFWSAIKLRLAEISLDGSLLEVQKNGELTQKEKERFEEFKNVPLDTWKKIVEWGKQNKKLSLLERKKVEHTIIALENDKDVLFSTANDLMKILLKYKDSEK